MAQGLLGMLEFNQRNKFWRKFLTASVINWVMMTHKSSHDDSNDWWLMRMTELMQRMTQTNFGVILTLFAKVIDHLRQSTKEKQQQQQQNSPLLLGRRRSFGSRASKNAAENKHGFLITVGHAPNICLSCIFFLFKNPSLTNRRAKLNCNWESSALKCLSWQNLKNIGIQRMERYLDKWQP